MNKDALLVGLFTDLKIIQLNILLLNRHDYRFEEKRLKTTFKDNHVYFHMVNSTVCLFYNQF